MHFLNLIEMILWQPIRNRVQSELIKRGHCVACTRSLASAHRTQSKKQEYIQIVFCQCRRVYLYNTQLNSYKRALEKEVENLLN